MMTTLRSRLAYILAPLAFVVTLSGAQAQTNKLVIESGDSAMSRQEASMNKEQWGDTRSLRQKMNHRAEKEWDKTDAAFDVRDNCLKSTNVNLYWEPNTERCMDRRTGHSVTP